MLNNSIIDTREYIFPIFSVIGDDTSIKVDGRKFLGTGFFVTKKGDAVTAAHVIPDEVESGRRLIAVVFVGGKEVICWINYSAKFYAVDFALIKINLTSTKYFPVSTAQLNMGDDVQVIGISEHETSEPGKKQMRLFKGYIVTMSKDRLELNFPVPAGMSGAPVLIGGSVVGQGQ